MQRLPPIYALTPNDPEGSLQDRIERLIRGGIRWIQIREKWAGDADLVRLIEPIIRSAPGEVSIFVNDRVDLAIGCGAQGVHLGDRDLPPDVARRVAGTRSMRIGVSTHSEEEAVAMGRLASVDYVALGPIFPSRTKMVRSPLGLTALERVRDQIEKPIVAIGGIDGFNIRDVLRAGADSAAIISALYDGGTIEDNVRELIDRAVAF